ncbi:MAG: hypothetical protein ACREEM_27385 [Blastocatellia bacterium]
MLLSYAVIGPVGQVGEVLVSATAEEIISATPKEEMMAAARALYEQNRETIEAPVSFATARPSERMHSTR